MSILGIFFIKHQLFVRVCVCVCVFGSGHTATDLAQLDLENLRLQVLSQPRPVIFLLRINQSFSELLTFCPGQLVCKCGSFFLKGDQVAHYHFYKNQLLKHPFFIKK